MLIPTLSDRCWETIEAAMILYWKEQGCDEDLARENAAIELRWLLIDLCWRTPPC